MTIGSQDDTIQHLAQPADPAGSSCCSTARQSTCCETSEKSSCCGAASTAGGGCGCQ